MHMIQTPSPNCDERQNGSPIDCLILHYTGMASAEAALQRLCDPQTEVSAHYMVDEDGSCYQLVDERKRAWHAGKSYWRGREGLNHSSIGIEIVNPGHEFGYRPFPEAQMHTVIDLCRAILSRHPIEPRNVIAHSDIAPDRKEDPGELFDWKRLAEEGIGLYPNNHTIDNTPLWKEGDSGDNILQLQKKLSQYGYLIPCHGEYNRQTALVVKAFKRHFCPHDCDMVWDKVAASALDNLLQKL